MATILIVDDSRLARRMIGKIVKAGGHRTLEAENGKEAVEKAIAHSPDCILLDLLMPEMSGFEVLRALKDEGLVIPVVVVSADIQEATRAECIELGAKCIIHKPPEKDELLDVIQDAIDNNRANGMMELRDEHLEGMLTLINLGVREGATVLNTMLNSCIRLDVPNVKRTLLKDLKGEMTTLGANRLASVNLTFTGDFAGNAQLMFSMEAASKLVAALTGDEPTVERLDSSQAGTLCEIGNIVLNSVMGSISNILQFQLFYGMPDYREGSLDDLLHLNEESPDSLHLNEESLDAIMLLAHTHFTVEDLHLDGNIVLFFRLDGLDGLFDAIDAFGVAQENAE